MRGNEMKNYQLGYKPFAIRKSSQLYPLESVLKNSSPYSELAKKIE